MRGGVHFAASHLRLPAAVFGFARPPPDAVQGYAFSFPCVTAFLMTGTTTNRIAITTKNTDTGRLNISAQLPLAEMSAMRMYFSISGPRMKPRMTGAMSMPRQISR